jgi:hypothetical protein
MQLSDFAVGKKYMAKQTDFAPPDGSPTVPGGMIQFTVLEQADKSNSSIVVDGKNESPSALELESWAEFLRVQNHKSNRVHLLHPSTLENASLIV